MMFGAGLLMMALIFGLPLLLIGVAVVAAAGGGWQRWFGSPAAQTGPGTAGPVPGRFCAHCGQALQAGWSHCPHCGAAATPAGQ